MLGSGPRPTPEAAAQNQRERLYGAMVAVCAERGYGDATVTDLIALAGVSRRDFYKHFADKEACFLATLDQIVTGAQAVVASRLRQEGSWEELAREGLKTFIDLLVEQPAAARLCLVDSYAAGPAAIELVDTALEGFQAMAQQAFEESGERRGMPSEMTAAMVGGLRKIVHTRLHRGTEAELVEQIPALVDLGLSYRPPPRTLRGVSRRRRNPVPPGGAVDGEQRLPAGHSAEGGDPADRITRATMGVVAEKGYPGTTIAELVEAAGVSLSTFYSHFNSKAEAFDAALYSGRTRLLGIALPAYRLGRSWPEAVRSVTEATLGFLSTEPEFTRLVALEVYAAGQQALERRDMAIEAMQQTIDDGLAYAPEMEPIVREAIISALYALLSNRVKTKGVAELRELAPLATYLALSPFIGPEEAAAVANGASPTGPASPVET
jgi:AcrR family transcriptional regulator